MNVLNIINAGQLKTLSLLLHILHSFAMPQQQPIGLLSVCRLHLARTTVVVVVAVVVAGIFGDEMILDGNN